MHTSTDIPDVEPSEIVRGSTVKWNKSLSHYKADDGWVLTYAIRGPVVLDVTATASGSDHAITLSTTQTTTLTDGDYIWQSYATKGSERFDVSSGFLKVKADFAAHQSGVYEFRSHAKKVLDAIEATLEGRATTTDMEVEINGKRVKFWPPQDLLVFRDRYKSEYAKELEVERLKLGLKSKSNIYTRFVGV